MLDRRLGFLLIAAVMGGGYVLYGMMTPPQVEFTRAPTVAPSGLQLRPPVSTIHVAIPVDLSRVARRTELALEQRLAMGLDAADPLCARRPPSPECQASRLDASVSSAGRADVQPTPRGATVSLPLKVSFAQGAERVGIDWVVRFPFAIQAGAGQPIEVRRLDDTPADPENPAHTRILRLVEARLRPLSLTAQDELRATLASLPLEAATEKAWEALSNPIDLGGTWLRAQPEVAGQASLAKVDGTTYLRTPIATRLSLEASDEGTKSARRPLTHGQVNTTEGAIIRAAGSVSLTALQPAIDAAFVKSSPFETRPDRFGPPVSVEVKRSRIYPAPRAIAVELDIAASRFEGQRFHGKAHILGRPVLDADSRVVSLTDVSLAPVPLRDAGNAKTVAGAPRLASDPFIGKLAAAVRIDVASDLDNLLAQSRALLQRRIDDRLSVKATIHRAIPVSFEISAEGGWTVADLQGTLLLIHDVPAAVVAEAPSPPRPQSLPSSTTDTPRKPAPPELSAAAVVSATAATAAATAAASSAAAQPPRAANSSAALVPTATSLSEPHSAPIPPPAAAAASSAAASAAAKTKSVPRRPAQRTATGKATAGGPATSQKREWIPF